MARRAAAWRPRTDLVPTLEAAFSGGGVHLVTVPIDYSENTRVLVDELRSKVSETAVVGMSRRCCKSFEPSTGRRSPRSRRTTPDALETKLAAAAVAFRDRDGWLEPHERIDVLRRLAGLIEAKREHFRRLIAQEGGKPLSDARVEVDARNRRCPRCSG